jgi:hypothetical protein
VDILVHADDGEEGMAAALFPHQGR